MSGGVSRGLGYGSTKAEHRDTADRAKWTHCGQRLARWNHLVFKVGFAVSLATPTKNDTDLCVLTVLSTFQSLAGYSSHFFNPFLALCPSITCEENGVAFGFNLIYSGSFEVSVEKFSPGLSRVMLGVNPLHCSWRLEPDETFQPPECVAVYEEKDGGMSLSFHRLQYRGVSQSWDTGRWWQIGVSPLTWLFLHVEHLLTIVHSARNKV